MSLYKEYVEVDGKTIKCQISFNREISSWATRQSKKIGYYVTCVPVTRSADGSIESFAAFSGFNYCLYEVNRQSSKRLDKAIEMWQEQKQKLLTYFETVKV